MSTGANHIGSEEIMTALGRDWKLSRWDRKIWKAWIKWAKGEFPDPVAGIRNEMLEHAYRDQVMKAEIGREQNNIDKQAAQIRINELSMRLAASAEVQKQLSKDAVLEAAKVISLGSPKAYELINSPEGAVYLLFLLMQKYQPEVTEDEAAEVYIQVGHEATQKTLDLAAGLAPITKKKDESEISAISNPPS